MSDLISRQAAIDAMCLACGHDCDKSKFVYYAPQDEQVIMCPEHYALSTLPAAEPERKTGHWIFDWKHSKATCSECGHTFRDAFDIDDFDNFCRHCGAKMEDNR